MAVEDKVEELQQQLKRINIFHSIPAFSSDIVTEILLRLPVKCLLRYMFVCKSWYFLKSDPKFIKSHLSLSTSRNDHAHHRLILNWPRNTLKSFPLNDVMHDKSINSLEPDYSLKDSRTFQIVGSCHGLLCLKVGKDLFICNPSTRRSNRLPNFGFEAERYGFGYDELSEDYKVVVTSSFLKDGTRVKIYSLKSDKWKKIDDFPCGIPFGDSSVFSNGALHWKVWPSFDSYRSTIVSLDLATETYGEILPPDREEGDTYLNIGFMGERLCVICDYVCDHADVWVMKIYGDPDSWTKLVSIQDQSGWPPVPCFMNDGKILLQRCGKLVLYDVEKGSSSKIENHSGSFLVPPWTIVVSLVSPGGPQTQSWQRG